jgi:alpha-tubulin suppressor-like RCC1 family protein
VQGLLNATAITGGGSAGHTCARRAEGLIACWGGNAFGQLGDGTTTPRLLPVAVLSLNNEALAVAVGDDHTCALRADDTIRCWGENVLGQLGTGNTVASLTPVAVANTAGSISAREITGGNAHTCARRANGTVACWGTNGAGELGDGSTIDRIVPGPVSGLTAVVGLSASIGFSTIEDRSHTCALRAQGSVFCWGANTHGQLGNGTTTDRTTPTAVLNLTGVVAVTSGLAHTCALRGNGTVLCWGENSNGQLGNGSTTDHSTPVLVSGLNDAVSIAAGGLFTCALRSNGAVLCWSDGGPDDYLTPTPVSGVTDAVSLGAGTFAACAVRVGGGVSCWGNFLEAEPLDGLDDAVAVSVGNAHFCALRVGGTIRCWGANGDGRLGHGTTDNSVTPEPVITGFRESFGIPLTRVTAIDAAFFHSCAVRANGEALCWGANGGGQLGDGSTTNRLVATPVLSFTFNLDPVATLSPHGHYAVVTVLANCPAGRLAVLRVILTQDRTSGHGHGAGRCAGALQRYDVRVYAHGSADFIEGPAQAEAEVTVYGARGVIDSQEWARTIVLTNP